MSVVRLSYPQASSIALLIHACIQLLSSIDELDIIERFISYFTDLFPPNNVKKCAIADLIGLL